MSEENLRTDKGAMKNVLMLDNEEPRVLGRKWNSWEGMNVLQEAVT